MKQFLLVFLSTQGLILEAVTTNSLIIPFIMIYASIFSLHVLLITCCAVAPSLGQRRLVLSMGDGNFRPPQNAHTLTDHQKIGTGDYVCGHYGCAEFGANPPMGGFWANGWNITKNVFIYNFFSGTHLQVRPVDVFSRWMAQTTRTRARVCLLGVSLTWYCSPILGVKSSKTPILVREGVFNPNGQNIESYIYYRN